MSACLAWLHRNWGWTESFVLFGLVLRLIHYVRNPSMWHDEAALVHVGVALAAAGATAAIGLARLLDPAPDPA